MFAKSFRPIQGANPAVYSFSLKTFGLLWMLCAAIFSMVGMAACSSPSPTQETNPQDGGSQEQAASENPTPDQSTTESSSPDSTAPSPLAAQYDVPGEDLFPEGIAFDAKTRTFFLGSLTKSQISQVNAKGDVSVFAKLAEDGMTTLGIKVDEKKRRLWACAKKAGDTPAGVVLIFDLDTAQQSAALPLESVAAGGVCNDVALDETGAAYLTDPRNPNLYKVDASATKVELWLTHDRLKPGLPGLGLNGLAVSPDQKYLLIGSYAPSRVLSVSLASPTEPTIVEIKGDALISPDGLVFYKGDLFIVSDKNVQWVSFSDATFQSATVTTIPTSSGLSTATIAEEQFYVVKSEVLSYVLKKSPDLPFRILRIDIPTP